MDKNKDILESIGKHTYEVPEGYFAGLRDRLAAIPSQETLKTGTVMPALEAPAHRSLWNRIVPYAALAACFAVMVVAGNAILSRTASKAGSTDYDMTEMILADLVQNGRDYEFYQTFEEEHVSEDDIINYLIESGTDTEDIANSY
jgi:hypothetical protein